MKKTAIFLLAASVLLINFGSSVHAEDLMAQIAALQQKAERVETQINQAKQQSDSAMDQQIKSLMGQADNLIKQRVQMDSQISKIDSQIEEIKNSAKTNLARQVKSYDQELIVLKQQMASLNAKKWAEEAQKIKDEDAKNQAQQNVVAPSSTPGQPPQK
jgi:exonuclease VII large subunit